MGEECFVSYAWSDKTTDGQEREALVDQLCGEAHQRGITIQRDRDVMQYGDRISTFMDRIARGAVDGRVFIVLSDKYLRSLYCMYELHEVWRYCMQDAAKFIERTRVFVHPSASIATEVERSQYVIHWRLPRT